MTFLIPFEVILGCGVAARDPSPKNAGESSHRGLIFVSNRPMEENSRKEGLRTFALLL